MASLDDAVARASPDVIVAAGARLTLGEASYPFLSAASSLRKGDADSFINDRLANGPAARDVEEFADFLVLGSSFHLLEGWRYLSKAAYALLNASRASALHLAYYAELRAARSILAGAGICVRDTWHFAITSNGTAVPFGAPRQSVSRPPSTLPPVAAQGLTRCCPASGFGGMAPQSVAPLEQPISTHVAASDALKAWATIPANGNRVIDACRALRLQGVDWVDASRTTASRSQLAEYWMTNWSIDLSSLIADSRLRNQASYGVDISSSALEAMKKEELAFVLSASMSSVFEDDGKLDRLDVALLHDFCIKSGKLLYGQNKQQIWTRLRQWLSTRGGLNRFDAKALVKRVQEAAGTPAGMILKRARRENRGVDGVFCRAYLLLRLASTMLRWLWREIRLKSPKGEADWQSALLKQFALCSHLTSPDNMPASYADFQEDQQVAIDDTTEWLANNPFSPYELWKHQGHNLREVSRLERIALWSCVQ